MTGGRSMRLDCAAAKVARYGLRISGDSVDLVERPGGGLSLILADGQGHGEPAKRVSGPVVARTAALLAEGARDGAAARMAHDILHHARGGRVSCTLVILSADAAARALVVSRSGDSPVYVRRPADEEGPERVERLDDAQPPLGVRRWNRPAVSVFALAPGTVLLAMSDGILQADRERPQARLADAVAERLLAAGGGNAAALVDDVLALCLGASDRRPRDDSTAIAMCVTEGPPDDPAAALQSVHLALEMAIHA